MYEQEKDCIYNMIDLADNAIMQGDKHHALTSLYFYQERFREFNCRIGGRQ